MSRYNKYWDAEEQSEGMTLDGPYGMISRCWRCKHYEDTQCCKVFPNGIPPEIWNATADKTPAICSGRIGYEEKVKL